MYRYPCVAALFFCTGLALAQTPPAETALTRTFEDPTLAGAWSEGERMGIPEIVAYGLAAEGASEGA